MQVIADVPGKVYAYYKDGLLVVVRGAEGSPFGPAYGPVRGELVGRCTTLGWRGPDVGVLDVPGWARAEGVEVSIFKVWAECPPYEHDCAVVVYVAV